jgi:hypothetical protein
MVAASHLLQPCPQRLLACAHKLLTGMQHILLLVVCAAGADSCCCLNTAAGSAISAAAAGVQVCSGVAHMHSRGYAHLDIKPHNVLIQRPSTQQQQQGPLTVPRSSSRPRLKAAAVPDSDDETDLEAGTSLVSMCMRTVLYSFLYILHLLIVVHPTSTHCCTSYITWCLMYLPL